MTRDRFNEKPSSIPELVPGFTGAGAAGSEGGALRLRIRIRRREEKHAGDHHHGENPHSDRTNQNLDVHADLLTTAASASIEGTQRPTKEPASLSTKNQRTTENRKEMNAAIRRRRIGLSAFLMFFTILGRRRFWVTRIDAEGTFEII